MGHSTNIYANNKLYIDNYKVGLKYEEIFYKMLLKRFNRDNIIIEQTDFYNYCDYRFFKVINGVSYLIAQIELKCRLTDTAKFNSLFCDTSKKINYLYDDEVNYSKSKGQFKEFILINNCLKEKCFYFNSFDKFEIKGRQNVLKTDLIKTDNINDIFNYIENLVY